MEKLYNVFIGETLVDFDLAHKLGKWSWYFLFGSLLDQARFLYDFDSEYFLGLFGDQFVASGKAALAQEVSLGVARDCVVFEAVIFDDVEVFVGWVMRGLRST